MRARSRLFFSNHAIIRQTMKGIINEIRELPAVRDQHDPRPLIVACRRHLRFCAPAARRSIMNRRRSGAARRMSSSWLDLGKGIYYANRQRWYGRGLTGSFGVPGGGSRQRLSPLAARAAVARIRA